MMNLFYREYGRGQAVIILHGLLGQSDNWVSIGRKIATQFHVYIPDMRNHGQSPHAVTHNYTEMVHDLKGFIETHQISNPILIGHSMGGKVAMLYALTYPHKVNKLIVIDISPRKYPFSQIHIQEINRMLSIHLNNVTNRNEVEALLKQQSIDIRTQMLVMKNLYRTQNGGYTWRLNLPIIKESMELLFEGIPSHPPFLQPTLFVRGGKSDYITHDDISLITGLFPTSIIKTISRASHWVHADAPNELYAIIKSFIEPVGNIPQV